MVGVAKGNSIYRGNFGLMNQTGQRILAVCSPSLLVCIHSSIIHIIRMMVCYTVFVLEKINNKYKYEAYHYQPITKNV